jgi:hypothetical protein
MHARRHGLCLTGLCVVGLAIPAAMAGEPPKPVDFAKEIRPLLEAHCIRCHSPDNRKGDFSFASRDDLFDNGYAVAGDPAGSHLIDIVTGTGDKPPRMPNEGKPLAAGQVAMLRRWIAEGAVWPAGVTVVERSKADRSWWSLRPLADVALPTVSEPPPGWDDNPIDRFLAADLAEKGLRPGPPADRRTLIRRASYDLTGLPPTPEEVEAFAADADPDAYGKLIDRLLASPRYGERWGRHWLDVVRFGESNGFERNFLINDLWPFRDWVIASINADKPFDRFVREHLAGDVFGADDQQAAIGSAFLVAGPYDDVVNQDPLQQAQIRADTLDEIIRSTGEAFLGLTVGCARCHNHKFDPITQADYYRLHATFTGIRHGTADWATPAQKAERLRTLGQLNERKRSLVAAAAAAEDEARRRSIAEELAEVDRLIKAVPGLSQAWIGTRVAADATGPFHVFVGGNPQKRGAEVVPASPEFLADVAAGYALPADAPEASRRQALADWVVAPDNPLTPRVLANRIWHHHFGTGIVATPNDFGFMGSPPSHPRLLDWLARRLVASGWRLKPLHRLIMTSQAYRQGSDWRAEAAAVDAGSRLLWRFPPRRLSAEEIRDTMLAVSGSLDARMGGPGFRLYEFAQDNVCSYTPLEKHPPATYRRAVYHQNARASVVDLMTDFDQADCTLSAPRRDSTTTPLQALTLLNHSFTLDMAAALAARATREAGPAAPAGDTAPAIDRLFRLVYQRLPTAEERGRLAAFVATHGLPALCRVLLNSNELLYLD